MIMANAMVEAGLITRAQQTVSILETANKTHLLGGKVRQALNQALATGDAEDLRYYLELRSLLPKNKQWRY